MEPQEPAHSHQTQIPGKIEQNLQGPSLSDGLLWLNERAWPLTIFILLIAGMGLLGFAQQERIPIPFSTVINILPALIALDVFIVVEVVFVVCFPVLMLLTPIKNSSSIFDLWQETRGSTRKIRHGAEFFVARYCCFMFVYFAAIFALIVWRDLPINTSSPISILFGLCVLVAPVMRFYFRIRKKIESIPLKDVSVVFWLTSIGGSITQAMLMLCILILSGRGASGSEYEVRIFFLYALLGVIALVVVQFFAGAITTAIARSRPSMEKVTLSAAIIIALPLMIPPVGAKITSTAFQMIGAGGRSCVILTWAEKDITSGYRDIFVGSRQSKELRIVFEADGIYRVRKRQADSAKIYFIPVSAIASVDDCVPKRAGS